MNATELQGLEDKKVVGTEKGRTGIPQEWRSQQEWRSTVETAVLVVVIVCMVPLLTLPIVFYHIPVNIDEVSQ
jgi:hypothetical protein